MLDDQSPKIDISNVFVWEEKGTYYIVKKNVNSITGRCMNGKGPICSGLQSTLTDVFTNKVIYEKLSVDPITNHELVVVKDNLAFGDRKYYARLYPIHEIENKLLTYANKQVPLHVLQQLYYKLNDIDITKLKTKVKDK